MLWSIVNWWIHTQFTDIQKILTFYFSKMNSLLDSEAIDLIFPLIQNSILFFWLQGPVTCLSLLRMAWTSRPVPCWSVDNTYTVLNNTTSTCNHFSSLHNIKHLQALAQTRLLNVLFYIESNKDFRIHQIKLRNWSTILPTLRSMKYLTTINCSTPFFLLCRILHLKSLPLMLEMSLVW